MNWLVTLFVSKMQDYFVKNWKTSLISVLAWIIAHVVAPKFGWGSVQTQEIMRIITDFILPLGIVAKDGDATGTIAQPRTDPAVVKAQNSAPEAVIESFGG